MLFLALKKFEMVKIAPRQIPTPNKKSSQQNFPFPPMKGGFSLLLISAVWKILLINERIDHMDRHPTSILAGHTNRMSHSAVKADILQLPINITIIIHVKEEYQNISWKKIVFK